MAGANTPDLQSILATLSQFTSQQHVPLSGTDQRMDAQPPATSQVSLLHGFPTPELPSTWTPRDESWQDHDLRPQPQAGNVAIPKPIDPATIITWQEGLRCVTKIAAQNVQFATAIRKMMEEQRRHEMRWYKERQALKQTQLARANSAAQAMSILQSLGGQTSSPSTSETSKLDAATELLEYDRKVYATQERMEITMSAELKRLGVPFFGTHEYLVASGNGDLPNDEAPESKQKTVTESDLLSLRRKMVGHLEDLYRD